MGPRWTIGELAERVGGRVVGDAQRSVAAVATLDDAGPEELSWVGDPKLAAKAQRSAAGGLLATDDYTPSDGQTVIRVVDPSAALIRVLDAFQPEVERVAPGIHPSAVVDPTAEVAGAAIGPHCTVSSGARLAAGVVLHAGVRLCRNVCIGRDSVLWHNVVVREECVLGERVIVHANATIGADGFSYIQRDGRHVRVPQIGNVVIEDDVEIGANTTIDRARSGSTRVRRGAKIDNLVQIGHNCDIGEHAIIVAQTGVAGSSKLGRYVMLAGQVGIADHVTIGDGTMIAAKSGLASNVAGGKVLRGIPAVDNREFVREQASVRRLPQLIGQVRELAKRIERLEATADDRP